MEISPVSGARALVWLERLAAHPDVFQATLSRFSGLAASFELTGPSLDRLLAVLRGVVSEEGEQPVIAPPSEHLSGPTPAAAKHESQPPGERAVLPLSTPAPRAQSRKRWLRAAGLILLAAVALAGVFSIAYRSGMRAGDSGSVSSTRMGGAPVNVEQREVWLARGLAGDCLPIPPEAVCSAVRTALWAGDPDAWSSWAASTGATAPTASEAQRRAVDLRLAAGDPAARGALARGLNVPALTISAVRLRSTAGERHLTGLLIVNLGSQSGTVSAVVLPDGVIQSGQPLTLAPGEVRTLDLPDVSGGGPAQTRVPAGAAVALLDAGGEVVDRYRIP